MRRILGILTFILLLASCKKHEGPSVPWLQVSQESVLLASESGSTATFTVTAKGDWTLTYDGDFDVYPGGGQRGTTTVTVTAASDNTEDVRVNLGAVTVSRKGGKDKTVGVAQCPETAPKTILMYMPWSGNLTSEFRRNITDMESVIAQGYADGERVVVFFMENSTSASLFELCYDNGQCIRKTRKEYPAAPKFTTAAGITSILADVEEFAPAETYAMTIGSHGMAWIPVSRASASMLRGTTTAAPAEKEYWENEGPGVLKTRWFGGTSAAYQTEISTLAEAIADAGMVMEFILFDDCYMSSVEVAYELRNVAKHLIGSTSEIMAYGFPYALMGQHMLGEVNYAGICDAFYNFYSTYRDPYGTIGITVCSELEELARIVKEINIAYPAGIDPGEIVNIQRLDGYTPTRFFDMGDYFSRLCTSMSLFADFSTQMDRAVPPQYRKHTPKFYTMNGGRTIDINAFSGITTSDPSTSSETSKKTQTSWWLATH